MRRILTGGAILAIAVAACTSSTDDSVDTTVDTSDTTVATTSTIADSTTVTAAASTTTTTVFSGPVTRLAVEVTGEPELVFDWTTDQCEPEHIPDIAARAFRDANDDVQLIIGHYVNYRMVGPSLDEVTTDCSGSLYSSTWDSDPSQFNDSEWIGGLYTADGETIYAVVHNEYRGDTHGRTLPDQCPSGERLTCLDTSLTMAVSRDGGDTYEDIAAAPDHMIATLPYVFDDEGVPSGLRQPSNIIEGPDGYFYVFSNVSDYPTEEQWVCGMRTDDLEDPDSWRFWDGTAFAGVFVDPYRDADVGSSSKCGRIGLPPEAGGLQESIVYDSTLDKYVVFGGQQFVEQGELRWGVSYAFSDDLVNWTTPQHLIELPEDGPVIDEETELFFAYISVMDPDSPSRTFDVTDGEAYLYVTRFNAGSHSLDRDLLRWPISLGLVEVPPLEWTFDTDGDTEGWWELVGLAPLTVADGLLVAEAIDSDPHMSSGLISHPAEYGTVTIRMRMSGTGETVYPQLFFSTHGHGNFTEADSVIFEAVADGEFHDYVIDLSSNPGWSGVITELRFDPGEEAGRTIDIDHIAFSIG